MNVAARIAVFATALAGIGGVAALAGAAIDPGRPGGDSGKPAHRMAHQDGLRMQVDAQSPFRFRIVDADGATIRDFDVEQTKRMHLIVVRRDLTGFQHLHPRQLADGSWTTGLKLPEAGTYTAFADFTRDGEKQVLSSDLNVPGDADLRALPAPSNTATTDGYVVTRKGLDFTITRDGKRVQPDPYLGARGHLVALREGDLEYLHVHPHEGTVSFEADFPTPGRYRLFLQFAAGGRIHTAEFTHEN